MSSRARVRPYRSARRRQEVEESHVAVDWSKGIRENMKIFLSQIVLDSEATKSSKLWSLNCFSKLCSSISQADNEKVLGFEMEEVFSCLRVSLLDDAYEVRAAGLRAMRHFIRDKEFAASFLVSNQIHLLVRSLDINLDNKMERLQALRLLRHLIAVLPSDVPLSAARALVAIARDGFQESDPLTRLCWAAVAELCLRNACVAGISGCYSALLDVVLQPNVPHAICDSIVGVLLFTLNDPELRHHLRDDQDLQHFVSPFTDCYTSANASNAGNMDHGHNADEQRELKFQSARRAILTITRSWSGLLYFCRHSCDTSRGSNAMQSLIETLHMPYEETRKNILELLFDLLHLRMPTLPVSDGNDSAFDILSSYHLWSVQDSWQLYDGFVAAEGRSLLPHLSKSRVNLFDNYLAIVLYALVSYGIVEALVQVIISAHSFKCTSNSVRATILLAQVLHLSARLLPHEVYRKCHALPDLVNAATCPSFSLDVRGVASAAIAALDRMHSLSLVPVMPFSLYLDQMMRAANASSPLHLPDSKSRMQVKFSVAHEAEIITGSYIRDSNVLTHDHNNFNWNLITSVLSFHAEDFKRLEEPSYRSFVRKLLDFFKPSGGPFSRTNANDEMGRTKALVCCHLVEFLLEMDDIRSSDFLHEFLNDLADGLAEIATENPAPLTCLNSTKLMTSLSHYYFLVIGRMTSSNKGSKLLEKLGIYQHLCSLIEKASHDVYTKLIISSLDYTKEGFSRKLLSRSLTTGSDASRLYATNLLLVLLRISVTDFHKWALPLLVQQLHDECSAVSLAASAILLESCDRRRNLEALIALKPSLLHLSHSGLLLLTRFASIPVGIKYLTETQLLDAMLAEWRRTLNLKYVHIVEDAMNEAMTMHSRSENGTYGNRRSDKKCVDRNFFLPPHLYGELAATDIGIKVLSSGVNLSQLFQVTRSLDSTGQRKMLELKASLWAIGHIASTARGLALVNETDGGIVDHIIHMANECDFISLRGTCFYILGMIALTEDGVRQLECYGWHGLRHARSDFWPLEEMSEHENLSQCLWRSKHYAPSVASSSGHHYTGNTRRCDYRSVDWETDDHSFCNVVSDSCRSRASSLGIHFGCRVPSRSFNDKELPADDLKAKSGTSYSDATAVFPAAAVTSTGQSSHAMGKSFPKLSPIASINSTGKSGGTHESYATQQTLPSGLSSSPKEYVLSFTCTAAGEHIHAHHLPFDQIPSFTDAHGYATLRSISRHRVHSLRLPPISKSVIGSDCSSSDGSSYASSQSDIYDENDIFSNNRTLMSTVSFPTGTLSEAEPTSDSPVSDPFDEETDTLIGIVLPISLSLLFTPPRSHNPRFEHWDSSGRQTDSSPSDYRTHLDTMSPDAIHVNNGLELHAPSECILCYGTSADGSKRAAPETEESGNLVPHVTVENRAVQPSSGPVLQPQTLKSIVSGSSMTSTSSAEAAVSSNQAIDRQLIRREVLRFVTNLSGSVAAKAAEQGMLNLKQRFPSGFQDDICLYSEICLQLSKYNFRLPARKFLQEIFLDLNCDQLRAHAKDIIRKRASNSLQETHDDKDEERSIAATKIG